MGRATSFATGPDKSCTCNNICLLSGYLWGCIITHLHLLCFCVVKNALMKIPSPKLRDPISWHLITTSMPYSALVVYVRQQTSQDPMTWCTAVATPLISMSHTMVYTLRWLVVVWGQLGAIPAVHEHESWMLQDTHLPFWQTLPFHFPNSR